MTGTLTDRVALVTGAASGIGAAVARELHARGARVFGADLSAEAVAAALAGLERVTSLTLDVREEEAWVRATGDLRAAAGQLDILVNCAGVGASGTLTETSLAAWRAVLAVNLDGAFLATSHGARAMGSSGAIVHLGSASGIRAAAGAAAYSTSKAALRMLVAVAAKELRQQGRAIRVNLVSPGGVKTPLWRSQPFFEELVRTTGSEAAAFADLERAGGSRFSEPEEIAHIVAFLVSDAAAHITGVELPVDDGYSL